VLVSGGDKVPKPPKTFKIEEKKEQDESLVKNEQALN
jgi:hypothetical protein